MTHIPKRSRAKLILLLATVATICAVPQYDCVAKELKLSDGKSIKILGVSDGTTHIFDTYTLAEKAYRKLPNSLRNLLPPVTIQGNSMHLSGSDSLAVGIQLLDMSRAGDNYTVMLSDGSGWYNSADSLGMTNDLRAFSFSMAPRLSPNVKLSFYEDSPPESRVLLGDITVPNPRYDPSLSVSATNPPKHVVSGATEIEILKLYTNLFFSEDWMSSPMMERATRELTTPVVELINGQAVASSFPKGGRSALVFKLKGQSLPIANLVNASLSIKDSKGSTYDPHTKLYISDEQQVLAWWRSMPVTDGNYEFTLTLHEAPPLESPEWKGAEVSVRDDGSAPVSTLEVAAHTVTAEMKVNPRRVLLKTATPPGALTVQIIDKASSTTLVPTSILANHYAEYDRTKKVWESAIRLPQGAASGPLTLKLAGTIEHQLKFSGIPIRPR